MNTEKLFKSLTGFFQAPAVVIDNHVFRLHYKMTMVFLIAFSLMIACTEFFGNPINCVHVSTSTSSTKNKMGDSYPIKILNAYWSQSTFSVETAWKKSVGLEVPYPGVENSSSNEGNRVWQAYYHFWKSFEGGLMRQLAKDLSEPLEADDKKREKKMKEENEKPEVKAKREEIERWEKKLKKVKTEKEKAEEEEKKEMKKAKKKAKIEKKIPLMAKYLMGKTNSISQHESYFYVHFMAEVLNLLNVLMQIVIMDRFLDGEFTTFGVRVLAFTEWHYESRYDPMVKVFPRVAKCIFHQYGFSGDVQKHDAMCILPINILNEKIYVFLWFWFLLLALVSALAIFFRLATLFFPHFRIMVTRSHNGIVDCKELAEVLRPLSVGDWFIIDLLARNIDSENFAEVINVCKVGVRGV